MKKETRDKRKRVQKYLSHAHKVCHLQQHSCGSKMKVFADFGCFARSDYRSPIYEFKILKSCRLAGINRKNDFQAYLAGLDVSSQNDHSRQKTQGTSLFLQVLILVVACSLNFQKKSPRDPYWSEISNFPNAYIVYTDVLVLTVVCFSLFFSFFSFLFFPGGENPCPGFPLFWRFVAGPVGKN